MGDGFVNEEIVSFKVIMTLNIPMVFWVLTPNGLVDVNQRF